MASIYTIPVERREEVEKLAARLQKKAAKYGSRFTIQYGDPYATEVPVYEIDDMTQAKVHKRDQLVEVFDLAVDGDIIRKDGYEVIAQIEHLDGGNVVVPFGGELKHEWINSDCRCEHCRTNRVRSKTFIVRGEAGDELQVGSTCLFDYCGINPQVIGYRNQLTEILVGNDIEHYDFIGSPVAHAYDTVEALAVATKVYREQGYVRSGEPGSNKERIWSKYWDYVQDLTELELEEAYRMAETIKDMDSSDAISFLLVNVKSLVETTYCKSSHFGYIGYAPVAYEKYLKEVEARNKRAEEREAMKESSEYVGEVGKRMTFSIRESKLITSWESAWGTTFLYKFLDDQGNVLVWFASRPMADLNVTELKATVKDHKERYGVKQTILTRCKVA